MRISEIGEFGLIERFRKSIHTDSSVVLGSGDDCAVLKFDRKYYQLFTCDMLVEGVDFTPKTDPYLVGRKSIAVSISDIAACAGIPKHCVVSLGLPRNTKISFTDKLSAGMRDICRRFKVNIVGGDISRSGKLVIDVSMLGLVEKAKLVLRKGAKAGDIICVTGELGGSIRGKHLEFIPRVKVARFLVANYKINSMIDISDGLAQDLSHIAKKSRVGAVLIERLIPQSRKSCGLTDALFSGEDFELLFTLSRKEAARLLKDNKDFHPVGEIVNKKYGLRLVDKRNRQVKLLPKGFRHF